MSSLDHIIKCKSGPSPLTAKINSVTDMYDDQEKVLEECMEQVRREMQEKGYVVLAQSSKIHQPRCCCLKLAPPPYWDSN